MEADRMGRNCEQAVEKYEKVYGRSHRLVITEYRMNRLDTAKISQLFVVRASPVINFHHNLCCRTRNFLLLRILVNRAVDGRLSVCSFF